MVVPSLASNHNKDNDSNEKSSSVSKIPSLSSSRSISSVTPSQSVSGFGNGSLKFNELLKDSVLLRKYFSETGLNINEELLSIQSVVIR